MIAINPMNLSDNASQCVFCGNLHRLTAEAKMINGHTSLSPVHCTVCGKYSFVRCFFEFGYNTRYLQYYIPHDDLNEILTYVNGELNAEEIEKLKWWE